MRSLGIILLLCLVVFAGCGRSKSNAPPVDKSVKENNESVSEQTVREDEADMSSDEKGERVEKFQPFYVFRNKGARENHYVPSGFMPNGKCVSFEDSWQGNCHSDKTCIKIVYDVACSNKDQQWAGIYWLNPANNWGKQKGGFNLTGAQKLVFWAKGEEGGEQIEEFIVGGLTGDYPDSDMSKIGPVILTPEWREYTIDLRGKDLSYISGGFAWSTNTQVNNKTCIFYLDDVRFE